jgi:DUF1680 family protein
MSAATQTPIRRAFAPVPFTAVTIDDEFWTPRVRANRERTIPIEYDQCRSTGRIDALRLDWEPGKPIPHYFWDSDVAKWIEAAAYCLATQPDPQLDALVDEVIALLAAAQGPDGYLNSHYSTVEQQNRWTNLRDNHELYCAGHLMEAAVAHYQATGKRTMLDVMCRYADYIGTVFGRAEGQKRGYCGHEEIELALVKLYHATGERRYLDLAAYFVDERGAQPHYFDVEAAARGDDPAKYHFKTHAYTQSHRPVREQREVVGHAVRAMYLYSAMADLAAELGDGALLEACEQLWQHLTGRNLYLTGGIGPSAANEGFTRDYDLPNEKAYAETCAAIGLVFWAHRLLQLACDGRYADVMERALYNGVISGVSLDGTRFFYENPLASVGDHHRQAWFDCACCPPNIARLLASLGEYLYGQGENEIAVHLYVGGTAAIDLGGETVHLRQATRYPWDGQVQIELTPAQARRFALRLRIPGWCRRVEVAVNGAPLDIEGKLQRRYLVIDRTWQAGDKVTLDFAMPVERIHAHPAVRQDAGQVALQRGPIVYCFEEVDQSAPLAAAFLPRDAALTPVYEPDLLDGVVTLTGAGLAADAAAWGDALYRSQPPALQPVTLTAIPYYAWDNRAPGAMRVWVPEVQGN